MSEYLKHKEELLTLDHKNSCKYYSRSIPINECPCDCYEEQIFDKGRASLEKENAELREKNDLLKAGIGVVRELMDESIGVAGLHMNGDIATWDSLEEGGQFEEWLTGFNIAEMELLK